MSQHLLCPKCRCLLLIPIRNVLLGHCPTCRWRGVPYNSSIIYAPFPPQKNFFKSGGERIWLAVSGKALSFSPPQDAWKSFELPASWEIKGLVFSGGIISLSPKEENTLGEPKPFLGIHSESSEILWQVENEAIQWTAPVADESLACAVDSRGQVAVVHPRTGREVWKRPISLGNYPRLGISPALSDAFVLLTDPTGELIWLARSNGREIGRYMPPSGGLDFQPVCKGDVAYLCAGDKLFRLDLNDKQSKEIFCVQRKSNHGWFFAAPVLTSHGLLILHADVSESGQPTYAIQLLDMDSGQSFWKLPLKRHPYYAPAVDHELVAMPDRNGHILLLDLASGEILHRLDLNEEKPASAPLFLNSELFLLTESGTLLRFSPDLRLENLPLIQQEYLARGDWESAALKHALQGKLNEAARLYQANKRFPEARALYELAGNIHERDLLTLNTLDLRLILRPSEDIELQENLFALLDVEIENKGSSTAKGIRLLLASEQMDITQPRHRFGDLEAGAKKTWNTLQIRPHTSGGLLLTISIFYQDESNKARKLTFEQGLSVLQSQKPKERVININIGGDVSGNLIVGDGNQVQS